MNRARLRIAAGVGLVLLVAAIAYWTTREPTTQPASTVASAPPPGVVRVVPPEIDDTALWMETFRNAQLQTAPQFDVFHGFGFTDRIADSGITFRHRIVTDAGKTYKAVHYDHGNGVAIADVDGDDRLDIYFTSQVGGNSLWRNLGGGRFEDMTAAAGVALADRVGVSASFADTDNDGDPDLYVTSVRGGNVLFENDGSGGFRDVTVDSGLGYVGHSSGAVFFDFNRDGRLDLFLVNVGVYTTDVIGGEGYQFYVGLEDAFSGHLFPERAERSRLFRNEGGNRFVDVSGEVGLDDTSWSGDASTIDLNEDGWPDLYVLNMQGNDEYYENVGGTRFERRSREVFPRTSWGAMGIKVFDVNNDGRMDIYITDMHSDMTQNVDADQAQERAKSVVVPVDLRGDGTASVWGNSLFLNEGGGRFREASDEMGTENYWPWGLSAGDLNADGFEDAFVASSMNYPFRYGINSLKLNNRGAGFLDAEFMLGIEPRRGNTVTAPWFELDLDGADGAHPDGVALSGRVGISAARGTRSSAIFDIDGDGDLDIVTNEFNTEPMVLVSNLSEQREVRYLSVRLTGTTSNRDGLGAVVRVTAGGTTYTKVNDGNSGYLSHSVAPLYFGMGDAEQIDQVEVVWPSGREQTVPAPISMNSTLDITEP